MAYSTLVWKNRRRKWQVRVTSGVVGALVQWTTDEYASCTGAMLSAMEYITAHKVREEVEYAEAQAAKEAEDQPMMADDDTEVDLETYLRRELYGGQET